MYFRRKTSAGRAYLQIVESRRDGDQVRQQVIATLGRFDELQASGRRCRSRVYPSCLRPMPSAHDGGGAARQPTRFVEARFAVAGGFDHCRDGKLRGGQQLGLTAAIIDEFARSFGDADKARVELVQSGCDLGRQPHSGRRSLRSRSSLRRSTEPHRPPRRFLRQCVSRTPEKQRR